MTNKSDYKADDIKVLEGLEAVRRSLDVIELSRKVMRKGDVLVLSKELKIKLRILNSAVEEGRVLSFFPELQKSKAGILARLRTDRELKLFSEKYNIYRTSTRKLIKLVRKWNQDIKKNPFILVTQEEHDLIVGSLMGDASIRKREINSCFRFSHSIIQKEYSNFKKQALINFDLSEFREVRRKIRNSFIQAIDFSTKTHPIFNYYRDLFYKSNKKQITKDVLNQLNPRSLAFWICDDGSYEIKQGYIILCTNSYSLEEHKLMKRFFNKKFSLDPTIGFRDGKYYYLRFKQGDTKKLIEIVKPFIPNCMVYKIGGVNDGR